MSKPVVPVTIENSEESTAHLNALLDSGSHYTIVREDRLPRDTLVTRYRRERHWGTANEGAKLRVIGTTPLAIEIAGRKIEVIASVAPELSQDLVIGAGAMQEWDITIRNSNGNTTIEVGRDCRDPDITSVV